MICGISLDFPPLYFIIGFIPVSFFDKVNQYKAEFQDVRNFNENMYLCF